MLIIEGQLGQQVEPLTIQSLTSKYVMATAMKYKTKQDKLESR